MRLKTGAIWAATMAFIVSSTMNGKKPAINAAFKFIPPIIIIHIEPKTSTNTADIIAAMVNEILLYSRLQNIGKRIAIITNAKEYPPYWPNK